MALFSKDKNSGSKGRPFDIFKSNRKPQPITAEERAKLKGELQTSIIEADTQRTLAKQKVERAIMKARGAIAKNDGPTKAIAFNELRMGLALYRYMGSLSSNLRMMESNLTMQMVTENFADIVHRMSKLKVPASTMNFNKLTAEALRGIQPVELEGIEGLTKSLIEGSMSATNTAVIEDKYLEDLVSGRISLDDPIGTTATVDAQPAYTETVASAPVEPAASDESSDDLMRLLDVISTGLKNGG